MQKKYSIQVQLVVPILLIAALVLGTMTFLSARNSYEVARQSATEETVATAQASANEMRLEIERGLDIARTMSHQFIAQKAHGSTSRELVQETLKEILERNKFLIGTWTGWEPNAWDGHDSTYVDQRGHDKTGRFVPYYNWEKGQSSLTPLIGYANPGEGDYYLVPKARLKETMIEPYLYPIDGQQVLITSASVPVIINGKFVGVAGIDLPLKDVQKKANTIKPFETSEAFVLTSQGNYVSHPDEKLITTAAKYPFSPEKFQSAVQEGKLLTEIGVDGSNGVEYLYVVVPMNIGLTEQPWSLMVRTPMKAVMAEANAALTLQLMIAACGILVLFVAVFLIARYISKSVSRLSEKLFTSSEQVSSAIQQLTIAGQALSQSSSESAASLEETVASLEEMTSMVKMNSENAKQAATLSAASSEAATRGEVEMTELLSSMKEISGSSKKIEEIINVIDDIAFQTNLLALNAAVEAARAGEQGKGFAVVAEAVRSLAQRSASAAKDITSLIKDSVQQIDDGTDKANKSGEALKSIVHSIKKVSDLNNEISVASEEQSTGISQISKAMNQLDQSVQSNAASSEEIAGTSDEINTQTQIMKNVVEDLNVVVYGSNGGKSAPSGKKAPSAVKTEPVKIKSVLTKPKSEKPTETSSAQVIPFDDDSRGKIGDASGF